MTAEVQRGGALQQRVEERSQVDGSQPVNTFRRPAARSGHTSSAFLKYAEDGEEDGEEEGEDGGTGPGQGSRHKEESNKQPRRKRFLDEDSDEN